MHVPLQKVCFLFVHINCITREPNQWATSRQVRLLFWSHQTDFSLWRRGRPALSAQMRTMAMQSARKVEELEAELQKFRKLAQLGKMM